MKRLLFVLTAACMAAVLSATTVKYTADNTTVFANPERGFYTELDHVVTKKKPHCVKDRKDEIREYYINKDKKSLLLVLYYLDNFKSTATLPEEVLKGFDEDMQALRDLGVKAILRFAYTADDNNDQIGYDAPLSIVESHIGQYKSHWEANADVIYVFQAGFVGAWGEWYYTSNFGNKESRMNDSRRALVDTLLAAVPADRYIQLRTPIFKTDYVGDTKALTVDEAYSGTAKARIGHHNDAFLYGDKNQGTYVDTATQKPYLAKETLYVPIGGETDILDAEQAAEDASYERTTGEMSRLHWTFLQGEYSQTVTDMWRENGTFDELNRKMGYRYQLVSGTFSDEVKQGEKLSVKLQIRNVGYAPLYNERSAYIVLKNGNKKYALKLATDPRTWLPNGVISSVDEQLTIPANVPEGVYQLYLHLPDAYETLASDSRYAVRFANTGVWNDETGMNNLGASVTVTAKGEPVDPEPQGDAIVLPATLNKSNVTAYSDDMTWYNNDYFDFGPEDAPNTERWAEWMVELKYPGKYIVSENMATANGTGHQWQLQLLDKESVSASYTAEGTWDDGDITYDDKWDLNAVAKGVYTLRVQNIMEWGQPKLRSLTLTYDGDQPTQGDDVRTLNADDARVYQAYDLLGRPVDDSYQGIVILNGKKQLRQNH
ncbi:MAG: DUF4832 domain-containing protein [Paludibacteraceae bacterium]|nr:DUF4832 domain-containing protein [Paludibacteraceae bacterium]